MIRSIVVAGVLAVAISAPSSVQDRTDFSGAWTLSMYRGNANAGRARQLPGRGSSVVVTGAAPRRLPAAEAISIRQTGEAITIEELASDGTWRIIYRLDGSESTNVHEAVTLRTRSRWENGRLVTEGTQAVSTGQGDVTARFLELRWMSAEGAMIVETTRTVSGRDPTTSRAEYAKAG